MKYKICMILWFAFLLGNNNLKANQADSVNIITSKSVIEEVNKETKSLGNYISVPKIIISMIILFATWLVLRLITAVFTIWAEKNTRHRITIKGFIPLIRITSWVGALTFILVAIFQPSMASVLTFSASLGVAIGFASQDLLKNIFGGIIIIFDKPFQIGDKVEVGNHYGEVVEVGLRSTRINTPDDNLVTVPNSEIMNQPVSNANAGEENCQVATEIYLPLDIDIEHTKKIAIEAAQTSKYIYINKPITVLFIQEKLGHHLVFKIKIKAYVNDIRNEFIFKSEITETLTKEFIDFYKNINTGFTK